MTFLPKIVAILLCTNISLSLTLEPKDLVDVTDFEGIRTYPVLKVSFVPKKPKIKATRPRGEIRSNRLKKSEKLENFDDEIVDNVREFIPMSRDDIKKLKKLSFHGRSSPKSRSNGNSSSSDSRHWPIHQVDRVQRQYNEQQRKNTEKGVSESKNVIRSARPTDVQNGFLPLMRPSPINIHPVNEPTFEATRNHVNLLKQRQRKFFAEVKESNDPQPVDEVEYFVKRERELADEQRPKLEHRSVDNSDDDENEEESRRREHYVPFRMYAQVRHREVKKHENPPEPQIKEKLTLEKKNIYYKEEGYNEKDYDIGDETVSSKFRVRRAIDDDDTSTLPDALALKKKSDLPNLTGEGLLKHLDELLRNSSILLPDETDADGVPDHTTIYGTSKETPKSYKYPYYNLPNSETLDAMSAFRYSENIKNFPSEKQSLYNYKTVNDCEEIDQNLDPVPDDIEEKGSSTKYNKSPQRLGKLGDKIKCYKQKYFGKDPFDNPLFKEKYVVASGSIPFGDSTLIYHQANPLITVYDDVISNIRAAIADELKTKRDRDRAINEPSSAVSASNIIEKASTQDVKIPELSSSGAVPRFPLFDINNYYPKFSRKFNVPSLGNQNDTLINKNESSNKFIRDSSKDAGGTTISDLRPPSLNQEKRRRRNPPPIHSPRLYSPSHFFQPPALDKFKFKLL